MENSRRQKEGISPAEWIFGQVKRRWGKIRRTAALFLAVCMTVSLMPELTWADTGGGKKAIVITEFKPLAERIAEQKAPLGTLESELNLPSKLKAMGYERGAGDINNPPVATGSNGKTEDGTDTTPHAITVTGVKWKPDKIYDKTAAGETFTFTAVLPERYIEEDVKLPEIVVILSEELKDNRETGSTNKGQNTATGSNADPEEFAITKQPHDVYALAGQEVPFMVEATGVDIMYQWQKGVPGPEAAGTFDRDSAGEEKFAWSDIDGADEAIYRFFAEEEDLTEHAYRCVLTCGEEELTTDVAKVKKMMLRTVSYKVQNIGSDGTEGKKFTSLQDAITDAANGDTLKLLDHINLGADGVTIDGNNNLTLDLGGKKITYSGSDAAIKLTGSAALKVTGTDYIGQILATGKYGIAIQNYESGSVSVLGGMVSTSGDGGVAIRNYGAGGVSVSGGTVLATGDSGMAIQNYGTGSVSVSGGTVWATAGSDTAIWNNQIGKITIKENAVVTCDVAENIGGTIYLSSVFANSPKTVLEISGGTVENTAGGYAVYFRDFIVTSDNITDYYTRSGGTVTGKIRPEPTAADKPVEILGRDGQSKGTYDTLRHAIDAAANGDILKLLADIDLGSDGVTIGNEKSLTLNLGDKNIVYGGSGSAIRLTDNAFLHVTGTDGAVSATYRGGYGISNDGTGSVIITGGSIEAKGMNGKAICNNGTGDVNVTGGTVSAAGTFGIAIHNFKTGKIEINGEAEVVSANTSVTIPGTIVLQEVPVAAPKTVLVISGGTVENTAGEYAVYFKVNIGVTADNLSDYYRKTGGTVKGKIYPAPAVVNTVEVLGSDNQSKGAYTTLQEAISEAESGDTLKLLGNIDLETSVVVLDGNKSLTLDLGDKTITYSGDSEAIWLEGSASLRIVGTTGTISAIKKYGVAIYNEGTGDVSIAGGTISATGMSGVAIHNVGTGDVNVTEGAVSAKGMGGVAIHNDGTGDVSVTGGTVSAAGTGGCAIHNGASGSVSVMGGIVSAVGTSGPAIHNLKTGKIEIGGEAKVISANTSTMISGTIALQKVPFTDPKTILVISGGTVENKVENKVENTVEYGYAIQFMDGSGVTSENVKDYYKAAEGTIKGKIHPEPLPEPETYTATVTLNRDGSVWTDNSPEIWLKSDAISNFYANGSSLPNGTYRIYAGGQENKNDTGADITVADAVATVELNYYTVTFYDGNMAYGAATAWKPQIILSGGRAEKPAENPAKSGFTFAKWVTTEGGTTEYNFTNTAITAKTDIYASWSQVFVTVSGDQGEKGRYTSLQDAIDTAADGDTLTLLADIDLGTTGVTIDGNRSLTLDLADNNITYGGRFPNSAIKLEGDTSLKITGTTGTVSATGNDGVAIWNIGTGKVSVTGGTVSATGNDGIAIGNTETGKITIDGKSKVTSGNTATNLGTIYLREVPTEGSKTVLEIAGGTVENTAGGYAVYFVDDIGVTWENIKDYYKATDGTIIGKIHPDPVSEPETYTATVTLNRDGSVWTDHNKTVKLKEAAGTAEYANGASVPNGIYRILVDEVDTNQTLTVNGTAAAWQIDYFTVTFYDGAAAYGSGTAQKPQTVLKGKKAVKPASDPTKTGFSFAKWVTTAGGTAAYDFENTVVTQKTVIYASWTSTGQTGGHNNPGHTSSGSGSGSGSGTTSKAPSTATNTVTAEDGGSVTTTTTTSTDSSGKQTTVTTQVTKDTAGNVAGSTTTVTTDNVQTMVGEGVSHVTVRPDGSAINSAAAAAGATAEHPLKVQVSVPSTVAAGELAKAEIQSVAVDVTLPSTAANNPSVEIGVIIGKETTQAAKDTGKNVTVTVRSESGSVEAVWSLDGAAMRNMGGDVTDISLGLHATPVQAEDPSAQAVKPLAAARGNENGLVLNISGTGKLTAPAKLTVPATNQTGIKAGDQVTLYRHDPVAGTLVPVPGGSYTVDANGNITIDLPAKDFAAGPDCFVLLPVPVAGAVPPAIPATTGATRFIRLPESLAVRYRNF